MPLAICVYYEIISSNKDHYNCSMIVRFPEVECIRAYAPSWIEQGLEVIGAYIMSIVIQCNISKRFKFRWTCNAVHEHYF